MMSVSLYEPSGSFSVSSQEEFAKKDGPSQGGESGYLHIQVREEAPTLSFSFLGVCVRRSITKPTANTQYSSGARNSA